MRGNTVHTLQLDEFFFNFISNLNIVMEKGAGSRHLLLLLNNWTDHPTTTINLESEEKIWLGVCNMNTGCFGWLFGQIIINDVCKLMMFVWFFVLWLNIIIICPAQNQNLERKKPDFFKERIIKEKCSKLNVTITNLQSKRKKDSKSNRSSITIDRVECTSFAHHWFECLFA